ncbi:hypothetical protein [Paenibacillus sp. UMB4589-SE434]|uniref:hypothetical protein n=1 Tax=Paenibacillus sp. UMB4589-SE434 TaxID=3046314 RepID=UPI00254FC747|nr:hypothetical protein [Paenibacillus sp. UMB4589-SE434]MDK8179398.1 hypothetical protein [Paenibacillus sp. UMB4589-SE434]
MSDYFILLIVVICTSASLILFPKLFRKGILNQERIDHAKVIFGIVNIVLQLIHMQPKAKERAVLMSDIANLITEFVTDLVAHNGEIQKGIALQASKDVLMKLDVQLSGEEERWLELIIEECLRYQQQP